MRQIKYFKSKKIKSLGYIICFIIVLYNPQLTFSYAYDGLQQWATCMVPTLFPFMMISSMMIYGGADIELGRLLSPLLRKVFPFSLYGLYAIFIGFLCGFPMGAKTVCDLYSKSKITRSEAETLLGFCNNIGPSFFFGIIPPILKTYGYTNIIPFTIGMYGIPLLYGMLLGIIYKKRMKKHNKQPNNDNIYPDISENCFQSYSLSEIFRMSCFDNTQALIILGGYITFMNACRLLFDMFPVSAAQQAVGSGFLEIISGIHILYLAPIQNQWKIFWIMTALNFSGISCMLQTSCFLNKEQLSLKKYFFHKTAITLIACLYYYVILFFL